MKKLLYTLGLLCFMASCTGDYTDWADPQSNPDEGAKVVELILQPAAAVDFATVTSETLQLFIPTVVAEEGAVTTYEATLANADGSRTITLATDENGYVSVADLQAAVESLYGKRPVLREIPVSVVAKSLINGTSYRTEANTIFSATPNAPEIEEAYYITGSINEWNNSNTDYELSNGGVDPYDNPIFRLTIPAPVDDDGANVDIEFKVTPKSGLGGDWSKCLTASDTEGKFATDNAGGNLKITAVADAKFYAITFDMMEQTWSYTALNFGLYLYEIGNESSWGTSHALYGPDGDGKYQGYYFLNGEFKFKPNADNWDGDYEYDGEGRIADNDGSNCPAPEKEGFYQIDVDLQAGTYALTEVQSITMVGSHNGWNVEDADMHMTFNSEEGAWEGTLTIDADAEVKFAMNDDWSVSWGGANDDALAYDNLTQYNGKNLNVAAGTYDVKLYLSYETNNKVVFTKK
ncbi:MAG: DUF5115 domain-containing protein [Phocaeicola sp.]|nr:DUF5115 domain-containing protein [Phocaeicola sp.]